MRITKLLLIAFICVCLSACVTSLLIGNQLQSKLMWSLFKPLVGFDPNDVKLLENTMVKSRMTALLGDKYEPTMKLLKTAQEIQQEGALFYVASRYAPQGVKNITDKAAMVWNADTNQMAVMLIEDGTPEIFSEQIAGAKKALKPTLPAELQSAYDQAQSTKKAVEEKRKQLLDNPVNKAQEAIGEKLSEAIGANSDTQSVINDAVKKPTKKNLQKTDAATENLINKTQKNIDATLPTPHNDEMDFDEALKKEAQEIERKNNR